MTVSPFAGKQVMDVLCECQRVQTVLRSSTFTTCPGCGRVYRLVDGAWGPGEPPEKNGRAKTWGRLATDFERVEREGRSARAAKAVEAAIPGFGRAWKAAEKRARRSRDKPRPLPGKASKTATKSRAGSTRGAR